MRFNVEYPSFSGHCFLAVVIVVILESWQEDSFSFCSSDIHISPFFSGVGRAYILLGTFVFSYCYNGLAFGPPTLWPFSGVRMLENTFLGNCESLIQNVCISCVQEVPLVGPARLAQNACSEKPAQRTCAEKLMEEEATFHSDRGHVTRGAS